MEDHIKCALNPPFFLSQQTPLPESLRTAVGFATSAPEERIKEFWKKQLNRISTQRASCRALSLKWLNARPAALKNQKSVNALLLRALMKNFGIKGQKWANQLIFGFPIIGVLSQKDVYPTDKRVGGKILHERAPEFGTRPFSRKSKGIDTPTRPGVMGRSTRSVQ